MEFVFYIVIILATLGLSLAILFGGIYLMAKINEATEEKFSSLKIPGMLVMLAITVVGINTVTNIAEALIK